MNIAIDSLSLECYRYLAPLAKLIVVAMVVEYMANRKTRDWNFWISFMCGITVMFRLYLTAWVITVVPYSEDILIKLFLFIITVIFVPISVLAAGKVWMQKKICGVTLSLTRLIPIFGMLYLFSSSLMLTMNHINNAH